MDYLSSKNKKRTTKRAIAIIPFILLSACTEQIVMDPQEEMPIVVNCVLTDTDSQYLNLYYSKRPSENDYRVIDNADISISGGNGNYPFIWNGNCYEATMRPKHGLPYHLNVIISGKELITAKTVFPPDVYIDSINLGGGNPEGGIDQAPAKYYILRTHHNDDLKYSEEVFIWILPEMRKYELIPWEEVPFMYDYVAVDTVRLSHICTDHDGVDNFNICQADWRSMADVSYMEKYYYSSPDLWTAYMRLCSCLPMHEAFLRIHQPKDYEGLTLGGESGYFVLSSNADYEKYPDYVPYFKISILSEEYDSYMRDVANYSIVHKDNFAMHYSAEDIYSNIEGGFGVFGAVYELN